MILTQAQLAAARLRADALNERIRAGHPDSFGPIDLPGGCWKLGMEDGSVLIVACGEGFDVSQLSGAGHDCPRQRFLDDPITQAYGLGGDMDEWGPLLPCAVCESRLIDGDPWRETP